MDIVLNGTCGPSAFGDASHRRKSHSGGIAKHPQECRHCVDALDRPDILGDFFRAVAQSFDFAVSPHYKSHRLPSSLTV